MVKRIVAVLAILVIFRTNKFGHILVIIWSEFGHILVIIWSEFGHNLVIIWSEFGQVLVRSRRVAPKGCPSFRYPRQSLKRDRRRYRQTIPISLTTQKRQHTPKKKKRFLAFCYWRETGLGGICSGLDVLGGRDYLNFLAKVKTIFITIYVNNRYLAAGCFLVFVCHTD